MSETPLATPFTSQTAQSLRGNIRVPGDKSVSHRALMIGALAVGKTRIHGLLEGEDVLRTAEALRLLGAHVEKRTDGEWCVTGRGVGGLSEPAGVLDMGNSGTAARLLMGVLATHPFTSFMTGDASLCDRPMRRVTLPLERFGASFVTRSDARLPLGVLGCADPVPINYELPVASAQVKSAILLAGLNTPGRTTVIEPRPTRDHTELMFRHFGIDVSVEENADGGRAISVSGYPEIAGRDVAVPGDISSAAFPLAAAAIIPGSSVTVEGVGLNPLRTGLLDCLAEMGAALSISNKRTEAGEAVGDVTISAKGLHGIDVPPSRVPAMIDEFPILAVVAACANGPTRITGARELRVKESDRIAVMAAGLRACGVRVDEGPDFMTVYGNGEPPEGGVTASVHLDHRIAMSFLVLGCVARDSVGVDDAGPVETSFPGFVELMNGLGASIKGTEE